MNLVDSQLIQLKVASQIKRDHRNLIGIYLLIGKITQKNKIKMGFRKCINLLKDMIIRNQRRKTNIGIIYSLSKRTMSLRLLMKCLGNKQKLCLLLNPT